MAESIYEKKKALFFNVETTSGTYLAPSATAFILTENFQCDPVNAQREKIEVYSDSTGLYNAELLAQINATFKFNVPHSWPAVAPAAAAGFLPIAPLLQCCGAKAPAYVAGPPANITYSEQTDLQSVNSGSLSFRRTRGATTQLERKSAGVRGSVGLEWEIGKVPRWSFDMMGSWLALASATSLTSTAGAQLTNLDLPAASNTVGAITLGGKNLCLTKLSNKNLFRLKVNWAKYLCGEGAIPSIEPANDITATFKWPNIDTEFNPDAYLNNSYPLVFNLLQAGGSRSLNMSYPTVQVLSYKEVTIGEELGCEMTLRQTSPIAMNTQ